MTHYIQYIVEPDELLLSWQPRKNDDNMRRFVGKLHRKGSGASFEYLQETKDFTAARKNGFQGFSADSGDSVFSARGTKINRIEKSLMRLMANSLLAVAKGLLAVAKGLKCTIVIVRTHIFCNSIPVEIETIQQTLTVKMEIPADWNYSHVPPSNTIMGETPTN